MWSHIWGISTLMVLTLIGNILLTEEVLPKTVKDLLNCVRYTEIYISQLSHYFVINARKCYIIIKYNRLVNIPFCWAEPVFSWRIFTCFVITYHLKIYEIKKISPDIYFWRSRNDIVLIYLDFKKRIWKWGCNNWKTTTTFDSCCVCRRSGNDSLRNQQNCTVIFKFLPPLLNDSIVIREKKFPCMLFRNYKSIY